MKPVLAFKLSLALVVVACASVQAQPIYKCPAPGGKVNYQQVPCVASQEEFDQKTATTCEAKAGPERAKCIAELRCDAIGAKLGKTRDVCLESSLAEYAEQMKEEEAKEQMALAERRRMLAASEAEQRKRELQVVRRTKSAPGRPTEVFPEGSRWESNALATTFDGYPGAVYKPNQTTIVVWLGDRYEVAAYKLNDTDVPAVYEIAWAKKVVPTAAQGDLSPALDCTDLSLYAKARGDGFFERAELVQAARRSGRCR